MAGRGPSRSLCAHPVLTVRTVLLYHGTDVTYCATTLLVLSYFISVLTLRTVLLHLGTHIAYCANSSQY
eukprot:1090864-Rhodomonas_salina.1